MFFQKPSRAATQLSDTDCATATVVCSVRLSSGRFSVTEMLIEAHRSVGRFTRRRLHPFGTLRHAWDAGLRHLARMANQSSVPRVALALLPPIQAARESARRCENVNTFRQHSGFHGVVHASPGPAVIFLLLCVGCTARPTEALVPQQPESNAKGYPYENGYAANEDVRLIDGTLGTTVIASGTVYSSDATPCVGATVTAHFVDRKDGRFIKPQRCLVSISDQAGKYEIRGQDTNGQSVFWAAARGQLGTSYTQEKIQLRGGETIVHVRDEACEPIQNATVTVHVSGVDDMAFIVPPNIRELLQRTTDEDGIVRYPSRLGDYELGFEVKAPGRKVLTRVHYSGVRRLPHKLFVISEDPAVVDRCKEKLAGELSLDPSQLWHLQVGSSGHFHGY